MESFRNALDRLDRERAGNDVRTEHLAGAMVNLVGLGVRIHGEPNADWATREMPEFRRKARDVLARNRPALSRYIAAMEIDVWDGTPERWYHACIRRSAIQVLIEEVDR